MISCSFLFTRLCVILLVMLGTNEYRLCLASVISDTVTGVDTKSLVDESASFPLQQQVRGRLNTNNRQRQRITLQQYFATTTTNRKINQQRKGRKTQQISCNACLADYESKSNTTSSHSEFDSLYDLYDIGRKLDGVSKQPTTGAECFIPAIQNALFLIIAYIPFIIISPIFEFISSTLQCSIEQCTNFYEVLLANLALIPYIIFIWWPSAIVSALLNCGQIPPFPENANKNDIKSTIQSILSSENYDSFIQEMFSETPTEPINNGTSNVNNCNRLLLFQIIDNKVDSIMLEDIILRSIDDYDHHDKTTNSGASDNESLHHHLMRALIQGLPYDSTRFVPKHDNTKGNSNRRLVEKNLIDQYNRLLSSIGQQYLLEDDLSMVQNDFQAIITANQHDYDVDDDDNDSDSVPSSMEFDFDVRKFTNVLDIAKLLQELANQNEQDNTSKSSSNNIYRRLKQSVPTKSMNDAEAGEDMCSIHEVLMCKMETLVASSVFVTQNNQVP